MKIYHVCEYCDAVIDIEDKNGPERVMEIKGLCYDCARELGLFESGDLFQHFYH